MSKVKIFHNPRCGKSRNSLKLLQEKMPGEQIEIIKYLETPPSKTELKAVVQMLGISADQLIRKNENVWKENFKGKSYGEDELIDIMVDNPILIERPIVIKERKAVIGRPPENILEIL
ncbi:arsenate reductase (glutaredoxin) [Echinicola sp. CAU 1574]|uniref:Arsenate reductase (Glutaredoxin) n=1 Tax=Echinicola arenosa TaxID=2774144 RepID=A0ABR9AG17_9BACT|nr:arsenate reductase (glutaredoxin) [Echinicola arenosa]MBD8487404.1 arsenate reductase (glutaredoxin) [Echinicola arenosa]